MTGQAVPRSAGRPDRRRSARFALWLFLAFAARLTFGLTSEFWGPDEVQTYLIGLRFFTTGEWPLYGPDVVYTETQLPGALQGLLVGGPLWIVPEPEAPYVLLNLLSFGALCLLAWYIGRRVRLPAWFLWPWVMFSPWTLNLSAHILNSSYVLTGAVPFFVGAVELTPGLRRGLVPRRAAFAGLGFGLLWIAQLHLSAALLVPVAALVVVLHARDDRATLGGGLAWAALGAAAAGWPLVPTILQAGPSAFVATAGPNIVFEPAHLLRLPQLAAQFFALPTFELARFLGAGTEARLGFLARFWWAAPFALTAALFGVIQTASLVAGVFQRRPGTAEWPAVKTAILLLLALVALSFVWSVREPASHAFYLVLPAVMMYAAGVWAPWLERRAVRVTAAVLLVCGGVTHAAILWRNFTYQSLYVDRARVVRAIDEKDYRMVGIRRTEMWRKDR
jgi:hypothetical protein